MQKLGGGTVWQGPDTFQGKEKVYNKGYMTLISLLLLLVFF